MALRVDLRPLRAPAFRTFYAGQAISVIGDGVVWVALPFAVLELGGGPAAVGLVLGAHALALAAFALVGGVWADRLPRRAVMIAADLVRLVVQATIGAMLLAGVAEIWLLGALQLVYGAAEAFFRPASTGLVPSTVAPDLLQPANALIGLTASAGIVLGPALGGGLVAALGPAGAFLVDAASFAVSAAFLLRLRVGRSAVERVRTGFLGELAVGLREVRARGWLWFTILAAGLWLFVALAPFQALGPIVAERELGGAGAWGAILAAYGVGGLVGGLVALSVQPRRRLLLAALVFPLEAPPMALLAAVAPLPAIVVGCALAGISFGVFEAMWSTTLQEQVPDETLSRVSSVDWMGSLALLPLGYALAGPLASAIGVPAMLWIAAAASLALPAALLLHPGVRRLERRPAAAG